MIMNLRPQFLAMTSYVKVRRVVPINSYGPEAGARLCNAIRKMLERHEHFEQANRLNTHTQQDLNAEAVSPAVCCELLALQITGRLDLSNRIY
ncbi:protein of unknown function [Taphrina deformans PYCC 5710]|uniref:Uncharacterized protein n=1 Tax=Taphrina deformans (strain PYCC 5710 / ATCC 11124 / CBS 356.35 / IMI 108563 / JCM 9778 / NBRC 8474) TaxID=1097556 RepID=R4XKH6_TAPDE|nr:protein of unknown function [Taphrina deformans PYCC 5710]|eukprot:CCG84959.1 protein of unknown function [Taphrina deformans PYCC 5710]